MVVLAAPHHKSYDYIFRYGDKDHPIEGASSVTLADMTAKKVTFNLHCDSAEGELAKIVLKESQQCIFANPCNDSQRHDLARIDLIRALRMLADGLRSSYEVDTNSDREVEEDRLCAAGIDGMGEDRLIGGFTRTLPASRFGGEIEGGQHRKVLRMHGNSLKMPRASEGKALRSFGVRSVRTLGEQLGAKFAITNDNGMSFEMDLLT